MSDPTPGPAHEPKKPPPLSLVRRVPGEVDTRGKWFHPGNQSKTKCHTDLRAAWAKIGGPEVAVELLKSAIEDAKGRNVMSVNRKGETVEATVKDWGPFLGLLPYIARKMPETHELTPMGGMTPAEVDEKCRIREENKRRAMEWGSAPPPPTSGQVNPPPGPPA